MARLNEIELPNNSTYDIYGKNVATISWDDYQELSYEQKHSDTAYFIPDAPSNAELVERTADPGAVASFSDGADNVPLKSLVVGIEPVQSGSGDPSPSNVRPISGWSSVNVTDCGKNLLNETSGAFNIESYNYLQQLISVKSDSVINISITDKDTSVDISGAYLGAFVSEGDSTQGYSWIVTNGAIQSRSLVITGKRYITVYPKNTLDSILARFNIQVEVGSETTTYQSYNGQTYTIDLDGTRYGGELNVTTGVLTVDRVKYDMGDFTFTYVSARKIFTASPSVPFEPTAGTAVPNMLATKFKTESVNTILNNPTSDFLCGVGTTGTYDGKLIFRDLAYEDAEQFQTAYDGSEFVIKSATPTTVTLTPTEVKTLLGNNNIWADSGDVKELVYFTYGGTSTQPELKFNDTTYAGSQVIANPEDVSPVDTLETVFINGNVYDIPTTTVTDTYSSTGSDATSGKAVAAALGTLDGTVSGSAGAGKTLTAFSQTDGKVSATFGDISITKSQVSDFPTLGTAAAKDVPSTGNASTSQVVIGNDTRLSDSRTPTSHTHGNIQNGGTLQTNDITIASGDKLVVTDSSDSNKIARTSISFDGTTDTNCLTQKGTWEAFNSEATGMALYGTCSTSAATAAKVAVVPKFTTLETGMVVYIKFTYSNTNSGTITLTLQSDSASSTEKPIYRNGTTKPGTNNARSWQDNSVVSFTYDGTAWMMNDAPVNTYVHIASTPYTALAGSKYPITFFYLNDNSDVVGVNPCNYIEPYVEPRMYYAPSTDTLHLGSSVKSNYITSVGATLTNESGATAAILNAKTDTWTISTDATNNLDTTKYSGTVYFKGSDDTATGAITNFGEYTGAVTTQIGAYNKKTNGDNVSNLLKIIANKDGTSTYEVSSPDNFRSAIGAAKAASWYEVDHKGGTTAIAVPSGISEICVVVTIGNNTIAWTFTLPAVALSSTSYRYTNGYTSFSDGYIAVNVSSSQVSLNSVYNQTTNVTSSSYIYLYAR